jgi:mRNA interferase MazF
MSFQLQKCDIVLLPFPFTNLSGTKIRPACVLFSSDYDVTVAFISTQMHLRESSDIEITPTVYNGLRSLSLLKLSKIATLEKSMIKAKIGSIESTTLQSINSALKELFQLP